MSFLNNILTSTTFVGILLGLLISIILSSSGLLKYLRPTIEGDDGKASAKRITVALMVFIFTASYIADVFFGIKTPDNYLNIISTIIISTFVVSSGQSVGYAIVNKNSKPDSTENQESPDKEL